MLKAKANRIIGFIVVIMLLISNTACDKEKNMVSTKIEKSELIDLFKNNDEKFITIAEYIESKGYEYFYCDKCLETGVLEISNAGRSIEINDEQVMESLLFIIEELGFIGIYGGINHYIRFLKESDNIAKGILYLKDDTMPRFVLENEKITDNWYYYMTVNP
jgi:hypothetical protein